MQKTTYFTRKFRRKNDPIPWTESIFSVKIRHIFMQIFRQKYAHLHSDVPRCMLKNVLLSNLHPFETSLCSNYSHFPRIECRTCWNWTSTKCNTKAGV